MPRRDWKTLEALQESPKGKLRYDTEWSLDEEELLERSMASCMLSPHSAWVLDNMVSPVQRHTSNTNSLSTQETRGSYSVKAVSPDFETDFSDFVIKKTPESHQDSMKAETSPKLLSEISAEVEGSIYLYREAERIKMQNKIQKRLEMFVQYEKNFADQATEQLKRFEEMMELKQRQERDRLQEQLEEGSKEALGQQEKLKEEHRTRAKLLNRKLREAEQQRHLEQERIRQEEGRDRERRLCFLQQEVLQLVQQIEVDYKHQETLRMDLSAYSQRGNQICGILSSVVRSSESGFPTQEDVNVGERSLQEMQALVSSMQKEVSAAEERRKAEEVAERVKQKELEKQQTKAQAPAPAQTHQKSQKEGLQEKASPCIMKSYQQLQNMCEQSLNDFAPLQDARDPKVKAIRGDLQKAIYIPVSQISSKAGSNLKEIFEKLNNLLLGKRVSSFGSSMISVSQHPQALDFVYYKLAEKLVKQGEEEIASHHEAAFPIAAVASGIWEHHPKVGELFLAHLYKKCPYALPFYPAFKEGTSIEEYQRILGYKVEDSQVEQQDNFLKRMSGMIRLYAAVMQIRWYYSNKQESHPHGLNYAWQWLGQLLNMEPVADITSTLLYDFLEVCGNALMQTYHFQFWKLLLLIKNEYLPRIEIISTSAQMGSVTRLRLFLENSIKKNEIPLPKGYLSQSFWRS
ncbi:nucleoporin GLE1 isoform X2 [Xenopus tropicalis]|uniref:mRNA export factor GLE1 n=1 Tax=Xenopus tropicalis TaxID=8364 RepID=A0A8J0R637_XENTR|nr:nucleoporin GLE1 isoform X2 [Xenopus tropicalis]|eukprot:XP_004916737.1 PREDICTED: nucleoporin GLE1 isoform X2 [Xenopus tropicalis]